LRRQHVKDFFGDIFWGYFLILHVRLCLDGTVPVGKVVDDAMDAIEKENPLHLKGVLPKVYARQNLDPTSLGELIDLPEQLRSSLPRGDLLRGRTTRCKNGD